MLSKKEQQHKLGSPTLMLFCKEFEDLHDDGLDGSVDEEAIFREIFFGTDISRNKEMVNAEAAKLQFDNPKQTDVLLLSNSGKSSLTSQDDCAGEDYGGETRVRCISEDPTSSRENDSLQKVSARDTSVAKPDQGDTLVISSTEGVFPDSSQNHVYHIVESSSSGVTFSQYQPEKVVCVHKVCEISGNGNLKDELTLGNNDQNESARAIGSPISQESSANKHIVSDPHLSVNSESTIHQQPKHKWKESCFLELDEEEFAKPKEIKNDPRPILRYHIHRLLRAAGWNVGRRKRNDDYNGIGEYVYKNPVGRPFRQFCRAWCLCGEGLLAKSNSVVPTTKAMQWADMGQMWEDLSETVKEIDDKLHVLETTSAMVNLWCLLDPFANAIFIEKTIRLLKGGVAIKAKRSLALADASSPGKHRGGPKPGKRSLGKRPIETLGYVETGEEIGLESTTKHRKRSRSEMESGKHTDETSDNGRRRAKKSRICGLDDGDLLISAIVNKKKCRTKKSSKKPLRKLQNRKGTCRLLPRNFRKGKKQSADVSWTLLGQRTVLSWLIHCGVLSLTETVQYRNLIDDTVIKYGLITMDGILCQCCDMVLTASEFQKHAGFEFNGPCANIFLESGKPVTLCQLEAWSAEYKQRKKPRQTIKAADNDQNDDSCGRCGDAGELICCDNCPSAFHKACLFLDMEELPEGSWYCPQCRCQHCEDVVNNAETPQQLGALKCAQCESRYHGTCMEGGVHRNDAFSSESWFCGDSCLEVHSGLQSRIGQKMFLRDNFSWSLVRCISGDHENHSEQQFAALKAECNSKLAVAITIMEECFLPMVDLKTGIDMMPQVIYNWGSEYARLNYSGFYTAILEKNDIIMSVASIRIHDAKVAEMPLIATCSKHRRQGMCRRLLNSIEETLKLLKVEKLVISAIPSLIDTWSNGFGFQLLNEEDKRNLSHVNLMVFPGSVWMKKPLYISESPTTVD